MMEALFFTVATTTVSVCGLSFEGDGGCPMPPPPARFPVGNQKLRAQVGHMSNILGALPLVVYAGWGSHAADGLPCSS